MAQAANFAVFMAYNLFVVCSFDDHVHPSAFHVVFMTIVSFITDRYPLHERSEHYSITIRFISSSFMSFQSLKLDYIDQPDEKTQNISELILFLRRSIL